MRVLAQPSFHEHDRGSANLRMITAKRTVKHNGSAALVAPQESVVH
jgi:hypothetical protein